MTLRSFLSTLVLLSGTSALAHNGDHAGMVLRLRKPRPEFRPDRGTMITASVRADDSLDDPARYAGADARRGTFIQEGFAAILEDLKALIEGEMLDLIAAQIAAGNAVDLNGTLITDAREIAGIDFGADPDAANPFDTVLVAPGLYEESVSFPGRQLVLASEAGPYVTAIMPPAALSLPSLRIHGGDRDSVVSGFTITQEPDAELGVGQRGVTITDASATVAGNVIRGNHDDFGAGVAIIDGGASPLLLDNRIIDNDAQRRSAAVRAEPRRDAARSVSRGGLSLAPGSESGGGSDSGSGGASAVSAGTSSAATCGSASSASGSSSRSMPLPT